PTSRSRMFFLLTLRRPPRYTLFPYTTLFRSGVRQIREVGAVQNARRIAADDLRRRLVRKKAGRRHRRIEVQPRVVAQHRFELPGDRKSTRLNSSHLGISYAVFCLKKKKKSEH